MSENCKSTFNHANLAWSRAHTVAAGLYLFLEQKLHKQLHQHKQEACSKTDFAQGDEIMSSLLSHHLVAMALSTTYKGWKEAVHLWT